ncbi:MAG: fused MFS/spermidine synthase [Patescibacteria group bacterium]
MFSKKAGLLFTVFVTGAAVLVVEVLALRILSPYYGNTIFSASSVMGVILLALSLGYYWGGKLADRHPDFIWFFGIILLGALFIWLLQVFIKLLLPLIGYQMSIMWGPLVNSLIMFFVPSLLLGTLSPYAIKLQQVLHPEVGVGSLSGQAFFWSTCGSIVGSLLTGFVLIPRLGVDKIIIIVGSILVLLSLIPILFSTNKFKLKLIFVLAVLLVGAATYFLLNVFQPSTKVVYSHDGVYDRIVILDGQYNNRPTRFFLQDRNLSSGIFLDSQDDIHDLAFDYSKYYVLYHLLNPLAKDFLVIGGAGYTLPKVFLSNPKASRVDVVEIEPALLDLAYKYFNLSKDDRLNNYVEDGRRFLAKSDSQYDVIFGDAFLSLYSIPAHLTTKEFFELAKQRLSKNGIFMGNFIGDLSMSKNSFILSELRTFQSVFSNTYVFAVKSPDFPNVQNIIVLGINGEQKIDFTDPDIKNSADPIIRSLSEHLVDLDGLALSQYTLLVDNYAPVEYLTAQALK